MPDQTVTKTENALEQALAKTKPSKAGQQYPHRPGFGTQGRKVLLYANYFNLGANSTQDLYRYNIDIATSGREDKPKGRKLKQIINLLLEQHFAAERDTLATDYKSNLISRQPLTLQEESYNVEYRPEDVEKDEPPPFQKTYAVRIQATGNVSVPELLNYLSSSNASAIFNSKEEVLQALNIVVGHYPKTHPLIASIGANRHFSIDPNSLERWNLGEGLEVLRGFFVSVRAATARLLLNVQVKNIACYQAGRLTDLMSAYGMRSLASLEKFLSKIRVQVTHLQSKKPRFKTINAFAKRRDGSHLEHPPRIARDRGNAKEVEFWQDAKGPGGQKPSEGESSKKGKGKGKKPAKAGPVEDGHYISVYDYFSRSELPLYCHVAQKDKMVQLTSLLLAYNIQIDLRNPVVNVGTRDNPSYLPAEVCIVENGQPAKSKLSPNQTAEMIKFAVRSPGENADSIVNQGLGVLGIRPGVNGTLVRESQPHCWVAIILTTCLDRIWNKPYDQFDYCRWPGSAATQGLIQGPETG